jgi:hypothetical protein
LWYIVITQFILCLSKMQVMIVRYFTHLIGCLILLSVFAFSPLQNSAINISSVQASTLITNSNTFIIREGYDFATRMLGDPWDMSQFADISKWLNHAGSNNDLLDIQVEDGIFSAKTESGLTYFFALYGGYEPGLRYGNIGVLKPISSAQYHCFYMAMKADTIDQDYFQMTWGDEKIPPTVSGMPYGLKLTNHTWRLYMYDLANWPYYVDTAWNARSTWESLKITPSLKAGTQFDIDWIRLTDCQPVYVQLTGLPDEFLSMYIGTGIPERQILIAKDFTPSANGSYQVDFQGVAPGEYTYYVKRLNGSVAQQGQIRVVPTPVVEFASPSRTSGSDYASSYSTPWDFADWSDVSDIRCVDNYVLENGILKLTTLPPDQAPQCVGANVMDPMIFMNSSGVSALNTFRYVSFNHLINAPWSIPEEGMVVRWVWTVNRGGTLCTYYSKEFPLDVGWQEYSADMYDSWNGEPAARWPSSCPWVSWKNETGTIHELRFEPNENITDVSFYQEVDWIRMTMVDQIKQGQPYSIKANLNVPKEQLHSINFYYTNNLDNPTQHQAYSPPPISQPPDDSFRLFMPVIVSLFSTPSSGYPPADVNFDWDTSMVNPGQYYICALANDGYNQSTYCSDAPIQVIAP